MHICFMKQPERDFYAILLGWDIYVPLINLGSITKLLSYFYTFSDMFSPVPILRIRKYCR